METSRPDETRRHHDTAPPTAAEQAAKSPLLRRLVATYLRPDTSPAAPTPLPGRTMADPPPR